MVELNQKLDSIQFSGIAKVIEKANALQNVIRLEVGDVDLNCPKEIKNGIINALDNNKTHYPPLQGDKELIELIKQEAKKNLSNKIDDKNIIITPGGSMGMYYIFLTVLQEGDEVLINEPMWPHLKEMIKLVGATPIVVNSKESDGFHFNFNEIENLINSKTKAILINTPNNPTGVIYRKDEILKLISLAKKHNIIIISDEEYCNYFYDNEFISPISFGDNVIISRSFSKQYSIAGLRMGYVIGDEELIKKMNKVALFTAMYPSSIVQYALVQQNKNIQYFINDARTIMNERMKILCDGFNNIKGLKCKEPEGGLYVWLCCKDIDEDDTRFADRLLYKAKVAVVPGSCFGRSGKGYLRVSLGASKQDLIEAVKRIKEEIENGK